jgi:hypothetical protein
MGEIATWSAVKTKVGLGKDSNECPTKAELLALSPTGTGENYVGLEISNASSYGNNETVQLSDIHKVTYRYAFTVADTVLNFPALGGYPTPRWFGLGTTKQKQIDGVAIGDTISVGYTQSAYPDWMVYDEGYKASENTTLNQRSASLTFTQNESGKQITVQYTQDAGVETWEYTFSVQNPNLNYTALGGSATPAIVGYNSFKQRYINGKPVGTSVEVGISFPDLPSWIFMDDEKHYTALENKSENSRSQVFTSTQNESGKKVTVTFAQLAGVKTYGTPTVYLGSIADIPASGGTAVTPTYTYSQLWGWNGKTNDGDTISSGASVVWSENISGSNLGTTAKARTKLGSRTLTVTLNGKSGSASIDIYQAENKITNTSQGTWVVSISANPSTFTEQGGTSQISASARASRINHWSSGATNAASDATGTPTLSIPTAVTGFSLSGTTLTVAENTTANQRSVVVRATMDTVYKEVTVTQSSYLVEWRYTLTTSTPTLNFDALGTTKSGTISSYREKYINGSLVEGSHEGVNIQVKSTSAEIQSATAAVAITLKENTTTQARTGTVVYEQVGSGKTVTITCSQAAGTVTIKQEFHAELGNYYSYGDSNQIPLIYQWYSPDSSDTTDIGDMTPGGYTGVWCNLPATGVINCMITGKPQTGKPMKARLSNLQARTIEDFDSSSPTEINKGLSVGYSQQDYQIGIEYSPGMNNYFLITPSILSEGGAYGGGIRLEVSLRSSYSNNVTTIATVTLTPKNSDHPTIYFEVIYG